MKTPSPTILAFALAAGPFLSLAAQTDPVPILSVRGPASEDPFGLFARGLDDLDGDGFADFAVSRPREGDYRGTVDLMSGRTGQRIARLRGPAGSRESFGSAIARLGDLDGDGVDEFAVGSARYQVGNDAVGAAAIYSGATRRRVHLEPGLGDGDLFGVAIANAGDVDADGIEDIVIGAPENGDPVANYDSGYARVISGRDFRVLHDFDGVALGDEFGASVTGVGDLDRDGHADVMIGSLLEFRAGQGSARVYSGRTGDVIHAFFAEPGSDHFGLSIGAMGDVDGDGVTELYASQISMTNPVKGAVFVFSGRDGSLVRTLRGAATSGVFGRHVRAPGDLDFDGVPDLLVADPADSGSGVRLGAVGLFSGATWSSTWGLMGPAPGSAFGARIALLDDVDGDGRTEILTSYRRFPGDASWRVEVLSHARDVARVGTGCAAASAGGIAPQLDSAVFSVGQQVPMTVRGARPQSVSGILFGSAVPGVALPFGTCAVHLDPLSIDGVLSFSTDVSGRWFGSLTVPADPGLIDRRLAFQALLFAPAAGSFDLTQGLQVTIGR